MIFADTGWFIALIDDRDALHARALRWLRSIDEEVITSREVLIETFNALSDLAKRQRCHEAIEKLLSTSRVKLIETSERYLDGVLFHRERRDKTWSLTDCISFLVMASNEISRALSHDHHFEQAGFQPLLRFDP